MNASLLLSVLLVIAGAALALGAEIPKAEIGGECRWSGECASGCCVRKKGSNVEKCKQGFDDCASWGRSCRNREDLAEGQICTRETEERNGKEAEQVVDEVIEEVVNIVDKVAEKVEEKEPEKAGYATPNERRTESNAVEADEPIATETIDQMPTVPEVPNCQKNPFFETVKKGIVNAMGNMNMLK